MKSVGASYTWHRNDTLVWFLTRWQTWVCVSWLGAAHSSMWSYRGFISWLTRQSSCWPTAVRTWRVSTWMAAHRSVHVHLDIYRWVKSLRPGDAIWRQRTGSTLAEVMACCLTAPSHYLNQCWLIISKVLWPGGFHVRAISQEMPQSSIAKICLKITCLKFHSNFPGVNELSHWPLGDVAQIFIICMIF